MFLLAGDLDKEGLLPALDDIAWRLRANKDELKGELEYLCAIGVLSDGGEYRVINFAERQAAMTDADRMRRYRDSKQKEQYYDDVTKRNADTDIDIDTDREVEIDTEAESISATALLSLGFNKADIPEYIKKHPSMDIIAACRKAEKLSKKPGWVRKCLDEKWPIEEEYYPEEHQLDKWRNSPDPWKEEEAQDDLQEVG